MCGLTSSISVGSESISMRSPDAASSTRSIALSAGSGRRCSDPTAWRGDQRAVLDAHAMVHLLFPFRIEGGSREREKRDQVHHGVRIQDSALIAAATLSDRYIADRFLPDKAIDLVDEAASGLRIEIDSLPTEIDEVDRRVMQLEIELTFQRGDRRGIRRTSRGDRT